MLVQRKCHRKAEDEDSGGCAGGPRCQGWKTSERQVGEGVPSGNKGLPEEEPRTESPSSLSGRTLRRRMQAALQPWRGSFCLLSSGATAQAAPPCKACSAPHSLPPRHPAAAISLELPEGFIDSNPCLGVHGWSPRPQAPLSPPHPPVPALPASSQGVGRHHMPGIQGLITPKGTVSQRG